MKKKWLWTGSEPELAVDRVGTCDEPFYSEMEGGRAETPPGGGSLSVFGLRQESSTVQLIQNRVKILSAQDQLNFLEPDSSDVEDSNRLEVQNQNPQYH